MKKLYFFALAALTAASAFAAGRQTAVAKVAPAFAAQQEALALGKPMAKADAVGFTSVDEVAGDYTWNYVGLLEGSSGAQTGVVTINVVDAATGEVTIDGIFSAGTGIQGKIKGIVDIDAGTLTVANKQDLGTDGGGDQNYFYFKEADDAGKLVAGASDVESVEATISGKSFIFPEMCIFAVGDFNNESLGWWKLTYANEFVEYSEPDDLIDLTEWTFFSSASMVDGWVLPVITYNDGSYVDPADFPLNVEVYQNNEDKNLFAIVNPYMTASGFPLTGGQEGYIVLDLTDPDFVLVNPGVFSGFLNGSNRLYCINVESFYVAQGYTKDIIQSALGDSFPEWSTSVSDETSTTVTIPNCRFNYPGAEDKMYSWTGRADAMKGKILINRSTVGVKAIQIEDAQAAPVYYNLQGVRVDNPANGIYIKHEGSKASKVFVK